MKLAGTRVVDLTLFLPGPYLTMTLADHGAEVIKVEPPDGGDPTRRIGPRQGAESVYFRNVNRGKKSVVLDLKRQDAREALLQLIETSDIVVESFRPGVAERLGFGWDAIRARAPRVVHCSISAFGQAGRLRGRPAHDLSIEAMAGVLSLGRGRDGAPGMPGLPAADMAGSLTALAGILMALLRARETGRGDHLDLAMHDAVLAWTLHATGPVFADGRAPDPAADRLLGGAALYALYETADGRWLALGGAEMKFATTLLTALGRPDLVDLCRLPAGEAQRPVTEFLSATFRGRPLDEWLAFLDGRDVCYAPVLDLAEVFASEHVREREMRLRDAAGHDHVGVPIRFADEPARPGLDAPALGADGEAVLGELGYGPAEVAAMAGTVQPTR